MIVLRPYQQDVKNKVYDAWNRGLRFVLAILPTGAGKTVTFSDIIRENRGASCAIAHRQELVSQISMALARDGVRHRIIGQKSVIKSCVNAHMLELGESFFDPNSRHAVAGVDTLIRRKSSLESWANSVSLVVQDEAHHVIQGNKWGNAFDMFPNARGLGVTATPLRADGQGLGAEFDGYFEEMIVGVGMRDLINMGFLTEYRIFAPPTDIDLRDVRISAATGDYSRNQLSAAVHESRITGDVVEHYKKIAMGKLGVTFAVDVETATEISSAFNAAGVPAAVVSAKNTDAERAETLARFKARELLQLVNVDLFGEGFDLPKIEVVSMARPTQSFGLYVQQFGRALRLMEGKSEAIIIDHVGNVIRHGLPDAPRMWTLARRDKRSRGTPDDVIPLRACVECTGVYERVYKACPYCGHEWQPEQRSAPQFVDGDLHELDSDTLAAMRGEVEKIDKDPEAYREELMRQGLPVAWQMANVKRHVAKQEAQSGLREVIATWAGYQRAAGRSDSESYRRFYFENGIDVLSACALGVKDAEELRKKIENNFAL